MSAIYKEPLSVLKRLLFVAMVVLGMTVGIGESMQQELFLVKFITIRTMIIMLNA